MGRAWFSWFQAFYNKLIYIQKDERVKVFLLSLAFFCIIGTYTVVRTLKDSLFINIVGGRESLAIAKLWSVILLVPAILLFSKLVDSMRRAQLLILYCIIYGVVGLVIGYFITHPTIGLPNTDQSPDRIFGWLVYFFMDGFNPFVVGLFWSFSHSITSPTSAKSNYPIMVAASKMGGVVTTTLACWWLMRTNDMGQQLLPDAFNHQVLFYATSGLLLCVPMLIVALIKWVPSKVMHGYEAAYKFEKQHSREEKQDPTGWRAAVKKNLEGLILMARYPYVMGILGVVFLWEVVNVYVNLERVTVVGRASLTMSQKTSSLLSHDFWVHAVGVFITILGTRAIIEFLGERRSLILVPGITGILMLYFFTAKQAGTAEAATMGVGITYILLKAVNYAFASPLRESLYIPTTKSVKFKSKSWIDSFGTKFAKSVGAVYSALSSKLVGTAASLAGGVFFGAIIGLWMIVAHFLGRRYEQAVARGEVIGKEE